MENYLNSVYLCADLRNLKQLSQLPTLTLALAYIVYCSILTQHETLLEPSVEEFLDTKLGDVVEVVKHFHKKTNKFFFLHFDEVAIYSINLFFYIS